MPLHGKQSLDPNKVEVLQEYIKQGKTILRAKWVDKANKWKYKPLPPDWHSKKDAPASKDVLQNKDAPSKETIQQLEQQVSFETRDPKRLHQHTWVDDKTGDTRLVEHPVGQIHKDDLSNIEHREELIKYGRKTKKGDLPEHWTDKLNVKMSPAVVRVGNQRNDADKYSHPKVGDFYVVETTLGLTVFSPQKNVSKRFIKPHEAYAFVQHQFEDAIAKSLIFQKMDILFKMADEEQHKEKLHSEYVSGDNKIILNGEDGHYEVKINEANMLKTESFSEAIRKYYREISKVIEAQSEDKDVGLELLGEKIVQNNRNIMMQMANMGKHTEVKWLKSWDFRKGPDLNSMPMPEEQDSADESGSKPTRQLGIQPFKEEDAETQEKNPLQGKHSQKIPTPREQEPITMNSLLAKMDKLFSKDFPNMAEGGRMEFVQMEGHPDKQEVINGMENKIRQRDSHWSYQRSIGQKDKKPV